MSLVPANQVYSPLLVAVPQWVFMVARVEANGEEAPNYGDWYRENRLRLLDVDLSASVVGQSSIRFKLSSGKPHSAQIDVENGGNIATLGDRVAVGLDRDGTGNNIDWLFCGYIVTANLLIDRNAESLVYKAVGPEWAWGTGNAAEGAYYIIRGQCKRTFTADDAWQKDDTITTDYDGWQIFSDEEAVFNPAGQKNMTRDEVILSPPDRKPETKGMIWEAPNRVLPNGDSVAHPWNVKRAAQMLVEVFGETETTGIYVADWDAVALQYGDYLTEVNVHGVGVWEALRRVCGAKYGFYIEPFPRDKDGRKVPVNGQSWGPFRLVFYSRKTANPADFYLNPRGTLMSKAQASVTRLEAVRDISKTVTATRLRGSYVRAIKLVYWGRATAGLLNTTQKRTALQHGWSNTDGNILDYGIQPGGGFHEVTFVTIDKNNKREDWLNKIHAHGKDHLQHWKTFRYFLWNEAGELDTTQAAKYGSIDLNFYAPNLNGIADSPEKPGFWNRRRRKMLDTVYLTDPKKTDWQKFPPQLFMAAGSSNADTNFNGWKWRRIQSSHYHFDEHRCAVLFTVDDLAEWRPFDKQDSGETDEDANWPNDPRNFASLLSSGTLRFCIECSVATDNAMEKDAKRRESAGSPFVREVLISVPNNFVKTLTYADGLNTPSGLTPYEIDGSEDAQTHAERVRDGGEDQAIHASLATAADWTLQTLGMTIQKTNGRVVNLTTEAGTGAQIVSIRLNPDDLHIEYLTESIALALRERDRELLARGKLAAGRDFRGRKSERRI